MLCGFLGLQDLNDNSPTFDKPSFTVNITEDFSIGQIVYSAMAFDPDDGSNAQLTYQLISDSVTLSYFQLESPDSGDITTSDTFDYDTGHTSFAMIVSLPN